MAEFDFFDDMLDDSAGATEGDQQEPELEVEESTADDTDSEGAQEEPTDEDAELDEEEEQDAIEINGELVTLDEIRELKNSELREKDYTKETQALAEDRKALESKISSVDESIASLASIEDELKKLLVADFDEIDLKALRKEDYVEYRRAKEEIDDRYKAFEELKVKAAEAAKIASAEKSAELGNIMGWSDESKYKQDLDNYQSLAKELKLTDEDAKTLTSPRIMAAMFELAELKKSPKATVTKPKLKKVKIAKRSSTKSTGKPMPKDERRTSTSYFD